MLRDDEIAAQTKMLPINEVAKKLQMNEEELIYYGKYKAKLKTEPKENKAKMILISAINPTPFGEGKTTVAIALHDAFCKLKKRSILTLREPSLGPVFGLKGGACGGGYAQIIPMEDINLHFNGDFHAITSANNLICAAIDNTLYFENPLNLDPQKITFKRCIDMNDRTLREVTITYKKGETRKENFIITAASELMNVFCLAKDFEDLKKRVERMIIGYTKEDEPVYVKDLQVTGSILALLKDAFYPNLVQTLENNPVLVHGGPFANIACGISSVRSLEIASSMSDYCITEAGFGFDLGGYKFTDILSRNYGYVPNCVVLIITIKALKYHGGVNKEKITEENLNALTKGIENLEAHIKNLKALNLSYVVTLNTYETDTKEEIDWIKSYMRSHEIPFALNTSYQNGANGTLELAEKVIENCKENKLQLLYDVKEKTKEKICKVCRVLFDAKKIIYTKEALEKLSSLDQYAYPICIAKTQYSLSDDKTKLGYPKDNTLTITNLEVTNGAGLIIVYLGDILTMPGLSKNPNYQKIEVVNNKIINIS